MVTYGISCVDCDTADWQYETRSQATEAKKEHSRDNNCRAFLIDIVSTDLDLLESDERIINPNDPPADAYFNTDWFEIPAGIGYRLAGSGIARALVGAAGNQLTENHRKIAVVEPGTAIVQEGRNNETTVRWQPDLREIDAWDRQSNIISGYGPEGTIPTEDPRS